MVVIYVEVSGIGNGFIARISLLIQNKLCFFSVLQYFTFAQ